jgi:carbon monoxide dehydrogenase subunit G
VRIEGTKRFAAPRERVWDALVDPDLLAGFLPGVQSLDVADETHWSAIMRLPLSPVSLTLQFELRDNDQPERALLVARGKRLGARVEARTAFDLRSAGDETEMAWSADVALGGTLSRLGAMLRPIAQQQAERFLDRLERKLAATAR